MISPDQFWDRLKDSGILSAQHLESLRSKIATKPAIANSARKIAKTLVANRLLTTEQAAALLAIDFPQSTISDADLDIDLAIDRPKTAGDRSSSVRWSWVLGMFSILIALVVVAYGVLRPGDDTTADGATSAVTERNPDPQEVGEAESQPETESYLLSDSTTALWARPQPGSPAEYPHLPAGTQMIVDVRLAALRSSDDGTKILRSLGPTLETRLDNWTSKLGIRQSELIRLTLFLLPQGSTIPQVLVHGELQDDATTKFSQLGNFTEQGLVKLATNGIWCPAPQPTHFYFGPWEDIAKLPTATSGRLRRELEQLRQKSHATDCITILANPNFLRDEAQGLFPDTKARLLEGLFAFWTDQAQAVSLGFQQAELAFLEVRMIAREELPPRHLAALADDYLQKLPGQTRDFLGRAPLDPFWQPLALRFPEMLAYLVNQTRIQVEGREVALTTIAPTAATHNLLLATELSLATPSPGSIPNVVEHSELTLGDLLSSTTTVRFAQKSLDEAVQDIAQQVQEEHAGLPFKLRIEVNGGDLEPEGITRNQQIRDFHVADGTLRKILTELVQKANPAQSPVEANSPEQKLVWMPSASDSGLIEITTRAAVERKGGALPEEFR